MDLNNPQPTNGGHGGARVHDFKPEHLAGQTAEQAAEAREMLAQASEQLTTFTRASAETGWRTVDTVSHWAFAWQRLAADFLCMRVSKNIEHGRRLMEAGDLGRAWEVQGEYARELITDYTSTVHELALRNLEETRRGTEQITENAEKAGRYFG